MNESKYRATLSQSQDRKSWAVIFRHPLRFDSSGRPGLRVRRGLGEQDREKAQRLVDQLNQILEDQSMWNPSSRTIAARKFDEPVVAAFYDKLPVEDLDFANLMNEAVELPARSDSWHYALLIGPSGSGKTTVIRQMAGTHPRKERFPSTAPGKTTTAQMEIILSEGDFAVAVTFLPQDAVRDHVEDCVCAAALAAFRGADDEEILAKLLVHREERFRLSYILAHGVTETDLLTQDLEEFEIEPDQACSPESSAPVIAEVRDLVKSAVPLLTNAVRNEIGPAPTAADQQAADELVEEQLDDLLRADTAIEEAVKKIMTEIVKRAAWLDSVGTLRKNKQGWPVIWTWATSSENRKDFIRKLSRLTSNHSRWHGTLLTPIVSALRVKGPFRPAFLASDAPLPKLVLIDGEGLGHIAESATTVPAPILARYAEVDVVILVDSAPQRMNPGAVAVLRSLATTGFESKLALCFTHFDDMEGDNLPTVQSRQRHIMSSVDQILAKLGKDIGPSTERTLRKSIAKRTYYLSSIDKPLHTDDKLGQFTVSELKRLLVAIETKQDAAVQTTAYPVYEITKLVTGVQRAIAQFHSEWNAKLGLAWKQGVKKEHWTRVRALTRQCAKQYSDHYDDLNPGGDFTDYVMGEIKHLFEHAKWEPQMPAPDQIDAKVTALTQEVSTRIRQMVIDRMYSTKINEWGLAFGEPSKGQAVRRAGRMTNDIYAKAVPALPTTDQEQLLSDITTMLKTIATKIGAELV